MAKPRLTGGSFGGEEKPQVAVTTGGPLLPNFNPQTFADNPWSPGEKGPLPNVDISQPGANEQAWEQHGGKFFQPGPASEWNRLYSNLYSSPTAAEDLWTQQGNQPLRNDARTEYDAFGARRPNIAKEPGFGSYYDQAEKRLAQTMNRQLGARGMFGSTMGADQLGLSIADLRADQAKNEAQYNLDRLAEERGWTELGGTMGRNADLSEREGLNTRTTMAANASTAEQDRLDSWRAAAETADKAELARLAGGMAFSGAAQGHREARVDQGFRAWLANSGILNGLIGGAYNDLLNTGESTIGSEGSLKVGQAVDSRNAATNAAAGNEAIIAYLAGLGR